MFAQHRILLLSWCTLVFFCWSTLYYTTTLIENLDIANSSNLLSQKPKELQVPTTTIKQERITFTPPQHQPSILKLPDTFPPPAQGGIIVFQHIVKTGGTTIRDNFKNRTLFPQVDYQEVFAKSRFDQIKGEIDNRLQAKKKATKANYEKTLFVELHGRNTPTLTELAPHIQEWKVRAKAANVPFFAFTLLRDPVELAISFFNHFHVYGDKRFGPNMPGTVENLRQHLPKPNPQCLYLFQGEQAYFMPRKFYTVTTQDCQDVASQIDQVMDWVGDTKQMSKDTLPLLTYWVTGKASVSGQLQSTNLAHQRTQKHQSLPLQKVDAETTELIRSQSLLDQSLYENAIRANRQKQLAGVATIVT